MNFQHIKNDIKQRLFDRGVYTRQVSDIQYVTRCPFCGDSSSRQNTGHFYIKINTRDNFPIVYNCFKCPASGMLTYETLEYLGMGNDVELKRRIEEMNKNSTKFDSKNMPNNTMVDINYNFKLPEVRRCNKIDYIENRLGIKLGDNDLKEMRVIVSFREFLKLNKINKITCKPNFARMLDTSFVGFLSSKSSHIIFRDITDRNNIRWFKYKIVENENNSLCYYSTESSVDIFTDDIITVNISEGILDILSAKHNLGYDTENVLNIAMLGKHHITILNYLVKLGIVGYNVVINIFSDADHRYDTKKKDTTIEYYSKILDKFTYIFGEVNIYYNMIDNDIGVPLDKIQLQKYRL